VGLRFSSVVDAPRDEVFAWHTRPGAITRLMPPWPPVQVEQEAGSVRDGRAVLRLPAGLRWVAAHQPGDYDPPDEFTDVLTSLPLAAVLPWRHARQFTPAGSSATRVTDMVQTPLPAPGAAADVRLPAPAAGRRPGRPHPRPGPVPGSADDRGHRVRRADRHRADRAAEHGRAPGHPAGPPAAPARRRALLAPGSSRPGSAGGWAAAGSGCPGSAWTTWLTSTCGR
jgi:ligand-binding SRPBCC domain-containing protein